MARKKPVYDDDDGRTIADMSGVERPNLWIPRIPTREGETCSRLESTPGTEPHPEDPPISAEDRRMYVLGALKAALLVALPFILGLGLIIALMLLFWV